VVSCGDCTPLLCYIVGSAPLLSGEKIYYDG
jgi:hypothetical protein